MRESSRDMPAIRALNPSARQCWIPAFAGMTGAGMMN